MTPLILAVDQSRVLLLFPQVLESWQASLGMFHDKSREVRTGKLSSAFSSSVCTLLVAVPELRSRPDQSQCEGSGTGSCENPGPSLHQEDSSLSHKAINGGYRTPSRGMRLMEGTPQGRGSRYPDTSFE